MYIFNRYFIFIVAFFTLLFLISYDQTTSFETFSQESGYGLKGHIYKDYVNFNDMMKISYPSSWDTARNENENTTTFISPLKTVGVIIQSQPLSQISFEEFVAKRISDIKTSLHNITFTNTDILSYSNKSKIQVLMFNYDNKDKSYQILQFITFKNNRIFAFTYYSEKDLFEAFMPIAIDMYQSFQTISFDDVFMNSSNKTILNSQRPDIHKPGFSVDELDTTNNKKVSNDIQKRSTYNNFHSGITLEYPSFLNTIEKRNGVVFTVQNHSIGITVGKLDSNNKTMSEFVESRLSFLQNRLNNFKISNDSYSNILGDHTTMVLFEYTSPDNIKKYDGMELWEMDGEKIKIFSYYALREKFDTFMPTTISMLESIKWDGIKAFRNFGS